MTCGREIKKTSLNELEKGYEHFLVKDYATSSFKDKAIEKSVQ